MCEVGKFWLFVCVYLGGNFIKGEDLKFIVFFFLYIKNNFFFERNYCIEEIVVFESVVEVLFIMDNKENNF